jgi:hypothetical protein
LTHWKRVERWFERAIDQGDDVYFVVGFHTVIDAQIIYVSVEVNEHTGRLSLPIGLTLNAAGVISPLGDITDDGSGLEVGQLR